MKSEKIEKAVATQKEISRIESTPGFVKPLEIENLKKWHLKMCSRKFKVKILKQPTAKQHCLKKVSMQSSRFTRKPEKNWNVLSALKFLILMFMFFLVSNITFSAQAVSNVRVCIHIDIDFD